MVRALAALPIALVRPDRAFAAGAVARVPAALLALILFAVYGAGERLVEGFTLTAEARLLAVMEVDARMGDLLQGAPVQVQARARGQMLDALLGRRSTVLAAAGMAAASAAFVLVALESWLLCGIAAQFFGGQEDRHGPRRPSRGLFLVAFLPLALRKLAVGVVMAARGPAAAANALSLAEFRRLGTPRFDLAALAGLGGGAGFLDAAVRMLTDPFFLWTFAIICIGGREVWRIPLKNTAALCLVLAAVLALQATALGRAGIAWEL